MFAPVPAQPVAPTGVALDQAGVDQLRQTGREDRGADAGPLAKLGERQAAPPELPDQAQHPSPAEQLQRVLNGSGGSH